MRAWWSWWRQLISDTVAAFRRARARRLGLKWLFGRVAPLQILPYRGFGTADNLLLRGRVLEDKGISRRAVATSGLRSLRDMYRRFDSDEIANAQIRATIADQTLETITDYEGYFAFRFNPTLALPVERDWHAIELELLAPRVPGQGTVRATGQVLIPSSRAAFGVISDIDDTVVRTGVTDLLTMARIVLLNSAQTRVPFPGVAAFYHALRAGAQGAGPNPIFYISNSPWNLYDLLDEFMDFHGLPAGPLLLQAWGRGRARLSGATLPKRKLDRIRLVLNRYPALPFVLIGDSGERDPEIYREVVQSHPGRIKAIYIRHVHTTGRAGEIAALAIELSKQEVPLLLDDDTTALAAHAAEHGLIDPAALDGIRAAALADNPRATVDEHPQQRV